MPSILKQYKLMLCYKTHTNIGPKIYIDCVCKSDEAET